MIRRVVLARAVRKQLEKLPRHIVENLTAWVDDVETRGLEKARKVPGYHDGHRLENDRGSGRSA